MILIKKIIDDIVDQVDNLVSLGKLNEQARQKIQAEQRIIQCINDSYVRFLSKVEISELTDLLESITPVEEAGADANENYKSYKLPSNIFTSREDLGIYSILLGGEEVKYEESTIFQSFKNIVSNIFYGTEHPVFCVQETSRKIHAPYDLTVSLVVLTKPENIVSADKGQLQIILNGDGWVSGTVGTPFDISDGTTTVSYTSDPAGKTKLQVANEIANDVNADANFLADAYVDEYEAKIYFVAKSTGELTITFTTEVGASVAETTTNSQGNYSLNIPEIYYDTILPDTMAQLLRSADPVSGVQMQIQSEESQ